jgi:hypothetical protein
MEMNDDPVDQQIKNKVLSLNDVYPAGLASKEKIWELIGQKRKHRKAQTIRLSLSIAASVALLTIAAVGWWRAGSEKNDHKRDLNTEVMSVQESEAMEYVNALCKTNNISCASPAFKELKSELLETSSSLMEIKKQIGLFGEDTDLLRAKTRIENHQARIIRAMVQIL